MLAGSTGGAARECERGDAKMSMAVGAMLKVMMRAAVVVRDGLPLMMAGLPCCEVSAGTKQNGEGDSTGQ